jgi:hypothetical protein
VVGLQVVGLSLVQHHACLSSGMVVNVKIVPILEAVRVDEGSSRQFGGASGRCQVKTEDIVGYSSESVVASDWSSEIATPCLRIIISKVCSLSQLASESNLLRSAQSCYVI